MDRSLSRVAIVCSMALFLPLTWPLLTGRVFIFNDLQNFHLPLRYLYANALHAGRLPLWTPAVFGGVYLHGEGQVGMLHPMHLALYRFLPLQIAFNLELLANYAFAFVGMTWLLRRLRLPAASALFGAMLFAFSGFQLLHFHHLNVVAVVAHIPWLLACLDRIVAADSGGEGAAGYAGAALVVASQVLLGFPQALWWTALAAGGFMLLRAVETGRWRRLVPGTVAGITGVLIGGVQLVPTLDAAAHSVRVVVDRSFVLSYSLSPWNIVQLWSPSFFLMRAFSASDYLQIHELGIYSGTILTLAPIWLTIRRRALGGRRLLVAGGGVFAVVMFVLALGVYGGLDLLLTHVPGIGSLRASARYIVLVQFALAILAAIAFDDLVRLWPRGGRLTRGQTIALCSFAVAGVLTLALWNAQILPPPAALPVASAGRAYPGVALVILVTAAFLFSARHVPWAPGALIVLSAVDIGWWGLTYVYREPPQPIASVAAAVPRADPAGLRVWGPRSANQLLLRDYQIAPGYLGLYPATVHDPMSAAFRALTGAREAVALDGAVTPLPDAKPRARLVAAGGQDLPGAIRVETDEPGHIVVSAEAPAAAIVAVTERFDDGWRMTVDDAPATPKRVDSDFLGGVIFAGHHRVEFRFEPRSFAVGKIVSAIGVLLLGIATAAQFRLKAEATRT